MYITFIDESGQPDTKFFEKIKPAIRTHNENIFRDKIKFREKYKIIITIISWLFTTHEILENKVISEWMYRKKCNINVIKA